MIKVKILHHLRSFFFFDFFDAPSNMEPLRELLLVVRFVPQNWLDRVPQAATMLPYRLV